MMIPSRTGEIFFDPCTGEIFFDPCTGEIFFDPYVPFFLFLFSFLYFFENYTGSNHKYYAWKFGFLPIVFQFTIYSNIF